MPDSTPKIPAEFVVPLNMNGLRGRMLRLPPPKGKKREILMVYGHHSSLERWYSLAQVVNDYGGVTMPDLPGFGGMDSFFKIGEKPDLDTMADYLASVIRLRFRNRKVTLVGLSYGFIVVTRMLQRYPDILQKTDLVVSLVGFAHKDDFLFSRSRVMFYRILASSFKHRLPAAFFRNVVLHPFLLRTVYTRLHNAKHKFADLTPEGRKILTEFEIHLWRINEVRTYMTTTISMLTVDNCTKQVDLPVYHIGVDTDYYFNNTLVEQHMRIIFNDFHFYKSSLHGHTPHATDGKAETESFIPKGIRKVLEGNP